MKTKIPTLKKGDLVLAQVIEHVSERECILSFHGELLRVKNESPERLILGATVRVRVMSVRPLIFQLAGNNLDTRPATKIDVHI